MNLLVSAVLSVRLCLRYLVYCNTVRYVKKCDPSTRMSIQCIREEVWRSTGTLDTMTATYQPEVDNFMVGCVARDAGNNN